MPTSVIQEIAHDFIDTSGDANTQSPQEQLIKAAKLGKQGVNCHRVKLLVIVLFIDRLLFRTNFALRRVHGCSVSKRFHEQEYVSTIHVEERSQRGQTG